MIRIAAVSLLTLLAGASVWAFQDGGAEMQMEMMKPSAQHEVLYKAVGVWDATIDMMGQTMKGTHTVEKGPGGFTTLAHFSGDMMGMPFEGRGIDGYDSSKKKYVGIWVDSMADSPLVLEGNWDAAKNTMSMEGEMMGMSGKLEKSRFVTTYTGNDVMDFEIFGAGPDGKEASVMHIHYTRKK